MKDLASQTATKLLYECPTGQAFRTADPARLAELKYDGRHFIGSELATALCEAAKGSVGPQRGAPFELQVRYACEDIDTLRARIKALDNGIGNSLREHKVGSLLTTIEGVGGNTAARMIASIDFEAFRSASQLAAYVGVAYRESLGKAHADARPRLHNGRCRPTSQALDAHAPRGHQERLAEGLL